MGTGMETVLQRLIKRNENENEVAKEHDDDG